MKQVSSFTPRAYVGLIVVLCSLLPNILHIHDYIISLLGMLGLILGAYLMFSGMKKHTIE